MISLGLHHVQCLLVSAHARSVCWMLLFRAGSMLCVCAQAARQERLVVMLNALLRRYVEGDAEGFRVRALPPHGLEVKHMQSPERNACEDKSLPCDRLERGPVPSKFAAGTVQ